MEAKQGLLFLNVQKIWEHEAEIEKINNLFLTILRRIKSNIDMGEQLEENVIAVMFQTMENALTKQKQESFSMDYVTFIIAGQIGQFVPMDKELSTNSSGLRSRYRNKENK